MPDNNEYIFGTIALAAVAFGLVGTVPLTDIALFLGGGYFLARHLQVL